MKDKNLQNKYIYNYLQQTPGRRNYSITVYSNSIQYKDWFAEETRATDRNTATGETKNNHNHNKGHNCFRRRLEKPIQLWYQVMLLGDDIYWAKYRIYQDMKSRITDTWENTKRRSFYLFNMYLKSSFFKHLVICFFRNKRFRHFI